MQVEIQLKVEVGAFGSEEAAYRMVHGIMCDALAEFANTRTPAKRYVDTRYPDDERYAWLDRTKKIAEVELRTRIAQDLRHAAAESSAYTVTVWRKEEERNQEAPEEFRNRVPDHKPSMDKPLVLSPAGIGRGACVSCHKSVAPRGYVVYRWGCKDGVMCYECGQAKLEDKSAALIEVR
jgi:hypothetical protein